jgi:hypothetical protein
METKYFLHKETGSIYKQSLIQFSDGEIQTKIQRYNCDQKNWSGHQANHDLTRKNIETLNNVVRISKEQMLLIIKKFN